MPCSGIHVSNTSEIGAFKVVSESGVASGVRRIEAVCGQAAVEYMQGLDAVVKQLAGNLRVKPEDLPARVTALQVKALQPAKHSLPDSHKPATISNVSFWCHVASSPGAWAHVAAIQNIRYSLCQ